MGINVYSFTSGNPIQHINPTGMADVEITMPTWRGQAGLPNADTRKFNKLSHQESHQKADQVLLKLLRIS